MHFEKCEVGHVSLEKRRTKINRMDGKGIDKMKTIGGNGEQKS